MKKHLLIGVAALLGLLPLRADELCLNVLYGDGTAHYTPHAQLDKVEFQGSTVTVVTLAGDRADYPAASIDRIVLSEMASSLEVPGATGTLRVYPTAVTSTLYVEGLEQEAELAVYGVDGSVAARALCRPGLNSIDVSPLGHGVYVASVAGKAVKIIKK